MCAPFIFKLDRDNVNMEGIILINHGEVQFAKNPYYDTLYKPSIDFPFTKILGR